LPEGSIAISSGWENLPKPMPPEPHLPTIEYCCVACAAGDILTLFEQIKTRAKIMVIMLIEFNKRFLFGMTQ